MIEKLEKLQQKKKRQNYFLEIDFYDGKNVIQTFHEQVHILENREQHYVHSILHKHMRVRVRVYVC